MWTETIREFAEHAPFMAALTKVRKEIALALHDAERFSFIEPMDFVAAAKVVGRILSPITNMVDYQAFCNGGMTLAAHVANERAREAGLPCGVGAGFRGFIAERANVRLNQVVESMCRKEDHPDAAGTPGWVYVDPALGIIETPTVLATGQLGELLLAAAGESDSLLAMRLRSRRRVLEYVMPRAKAVEMFCWRNAVLARLTEYVMPPSP